MDIERLKELVQAEDSDLWDYKVELTGLLDEAIARQSVKSEEVQRAIDFMENELEIIESFTSKYEFFSKNISIFKTILTALQEYQPWVSASDRPRKDNKYLAVLQFYKEPKDKTIEVVEYYGEWKVNYEWNVTHWKPLPEIPKGE